MSLIARIKDPKILAEQWSGFVGPFETEETAVDWVEKLGFKQVEIRHNQQPYWTKSGWFKIQLDEFLSIEDARIYFEFMESPEEFKVRR